METALVHRVTRLSSPATIDEDLGALWRTVGAELRVVRTAMANLVVFMADGDEKSGRVPLDDVIGRHPSRVIVLRHSRVERVRCPPTAASIGIVSFGPPNARYAVEEIALESTCGDASLASIVRRFTRGDLPTALWWTEDFATAAPILDLARQSNQLIFDSRGWRDIGAALAAVAPLTTLRQGPRLVDVNWRRLTSLRHALVHAARTVTAHLEGLASIRVGYDPAEAALAWLLTGWMASRLGWPPGAWPVRLDEAAGSDALLTISAGRVTLVMTPLQITAYAGGDAPVFQMTTRQESTAEAVAAELSSLAPDDSLRDALTALIHRLAA
jgi:glucose-6-phosphate dehydrogenase assembly protein OpcA